MTCNQIREWMPDLAAGVKAATPEVKQHLQGCVACASKLEGFRQTMALLDQWQAPEPSPYFDVRLHARMREEAANAPAGWRAWLRKPAMALALTVLVAAGVSLFQGDLVPHHGEASLPSLWSHEIQVASEPGTAVGDLSQLDTNHDLYSDFDLLDDLQVQQDVSANP